MNRRPILVGGLVAVAAVVVALLSGGAPNGSAQAFNTGVFHAACKFSHSAQDDPLVNPGQPGGAAHLHQFGGNTSTNAFSTGGSLVAANTPVGSGTDCTRPDDGTAYWVEGLVDEVVPGDPTSYVTYFPKALATYWHGDFNPTIYQAVTPPDGFGEILHRDGVNGTVAWGCALNGGLVEAPSQCSSGKLIAKFSEAANCWDGVSQYPANTFTLAQSNLTHTTSAKCVAMGWKIIPGVGGFLQYDVGTGQHHWALAYDQKLGMYPPTDHMHMDIMFGWSQPDSNGVSASLARLISVCLNDPANRPSRNLPGQPSCIGAGT